MRTALCNLRFFSASTPAKPLTNAYHYVPVFFQNLGFVEKECFDYLYSEHQDYGPFYSSAFVYSVLSEHVSWMELCSEDLCLQYREMLD